jgi:hypothetical protein
MRLLCGGLRPWTINVTHPDGSEKAGQEFASFVRPYRCQVQQCKCCCYQEMTVIASGSVLGSFEEKCWVCIPSFAIKDDKGDDKYNIHMPTCCGGMCVDCCAEGCCNCKIPFYIYAPEADVPGKEVGKIIKVWRSMASELISVSTFKVDFPEDATPELKTTILGSTFMINSIYFESQQ